MVIYWMVFLVIGFMCKMWIYAVVSFPLLVFNFVLNAMWVLRYGVIGNW